MSATAKDIQTQSAKESARDLSVFLHTHADIEEIQIGSVHGDSKTVRLPVQALHLLQEILVELGMGNDVRVIPVSAELTTQEAADLLNVSRPFIVQLLERKEIPFRKVGTHRRIRYEDLMAYKDRFDAERRAALDELTQEAQELKMGYD
ncbi:helix-turn-helix domain-containing protein [Acidithiobacillus sp. MC6.1]|nr:helix-turn-helix domain-containing protein [Acidithiobacillus sp. MC6.1]